MRWGVNEMQSTDENCSVAIVGAGFTGAILASEILRNTLLSVKLIEPARPGQGIAYSTECSWHLLNVTAGNMSAIAEEPRHFLIWARAHYDRNCQAEDYLPRRVYCLYVESILAREVAANPGRLKVIRDEAVAIDPSARGYEILLRDGRPVAANKVVLALGNPPPRDPPLPGRTTHSRRFISNPWSANALEQISRNEPQVLLIGSGLTSIDVALELRAQGFTGIIHMLSRHGLLPQPHTAISDRCQTWPPRALPANARGLFRVIRAQVAAVEREGGNWREVIDALRPCTQQIWRSFSVAEQRRFLRHLRPYWDVHRHRIAPAIFNRVKNEIRSDTIQVHAGRILSYDETDNTAVVRYTERESGAINCLPVSHVVNCTGPEYDCRDSRNPVLHDLLAQGLARPDALHLGIDVSENFGLIGADGRASNSLYALGPMLKGTLWETIAVPELRVQIARVAGMLSKAQLRTTSTHVTDSLHSPEIRRPRQEHAQ